MPRAARKRSETGIYHVMLRGIDRQKIFEDAEDCFHFLELLQECRELSGFELYAYCLMSNHVHLLLKVRDETLESIFKRIGSRYVYYFNTKYQRVGHLFQDRFKSEPVETDAYLLTVLRYIHQNPVKAKLCTKVAAYPYSSYPEYLGAGAGFASLEDTEPSSGLVGTAFVLSMLSRDEFIRYNNEVNSDTCLDITDSDRHPVTDVQASDLIHKISHCTTVAEFQRLNEKDKQKYIKLIYKKGVSIRQLGRLTGISKGMIEKYLKG